MNDEIVRNVVLSFWLISSPIKTYYSSFDDKITILKHHKFKMNVKKTESHP